MELLQIVVDVLTNQGPVRAGLLDDPDSRVGAVVGNALQIGQQLQELGPQLYSAVPAT